MNHQVLQVAPVANDLPDEMVTAGDITQALKISYPTLIRMIARGDLPAQKVGGRWKISRRKLREFMDGDRSAVTAAAGSEGPAPLVREQVMLCNECGEPLQIIQGVSGKLRYECRGCRG